MVTLICCWLIQGPVLCLDAGSRSPVLISGSADNSVALTSMSPRGQSTVIVAHALPHQGTSCVSVRADCKIVACGGWDSQLRLFQLKCGSSQQTVDPLWKLKPLGVFNFHREAITDVICSDPSAQRPMVDFGSGCETPVSNWIVTSARDRRIALWALY
jgi:WD40 repeat protein